MFTKKSVSSVFSVLFVLVFMLAQVGPAYAFGTGTISGTIKDADENPITGVAIQVRAVLKSDGSEVAVTASNPADGTYSLAGLPLDTELAVVASDEDPDVDGYAGEYYKNVGWWDWAEAILLTSSVPDRGGVDFNLDNGGVALEQLTFNTRAGLLLNDVNIRKAIAYGINRPELLYNAFLPNSNLGIIMHSMVAPGLWYQAAHSDLTIYTYDRATAGDILDAAGWTDTNADGIRDNGVSGEGHVELELEFATTTAQLRVDSSNLFKDQMQGIGILINVTTYPASDFFSNDPAVSPLLSGNFDIAEFAWVLEDYDTLSGVYNTGDAQNFGGYSNTTLDGYYTAARDAKVAGDQAAFQTNALLWQQTIADDLPVLPLFTRNSITPAEVAIGTDVFVSADNAIATFAHVTGDGWFGIAASKYNPNDLPAGYTQGDPNVYEVGSNAAFDTARVCITYDASRMSMANEYFLKMFHLTEGVWTDVTVPATLDVDANRICGDFTGFSVVALMYDDSVSGSISGTVMDDSSAPITGMSVRVIAISEDGWVLEQVDTNSADGTYTISGLPLDLNMKISASDNNYPPTYGSEYYPEAALSSAATVFNLTVGTPSYSDVDFTLPPAARPGPTTEHLTFNVRVGRFLNDPLIRRAIAYGTDRERMLEAFLSSDTYGVVLNSLIAPGYWSQPAYDQVSIYPYNPVQARAILDAAGITDHNGNGIRDIGGNDIILDFKTTTASSRIASSAIFAANMTAIGIQVNVTHIPSGDFFSDDPAVGPLVAGNFDIAEFAWVGGDLSVDDAYPIGLYRTDNFQNFGGYSNATADAEYDAAFAATNRTDMLPHVLAYYAATTDDIPSLPLFTRESVTPVDTSSGTNVLADLSGMGVTVLYQNAATDGRTAALASVINPGDLPASNTLVALYEIGSSVTMSTGTGATVCINYDDAGLTGADEDKLQLYHLTMNGARAWTNILTTLDTTANQVCGFTKNFSTFAVLLPDGTPPAAFNKISPLNGTTNLLPNLTLQWAASTGATSYEICYDTNNNNLCDGSWVNQGSATSAAINVPRYGTTYYWQARAVNSSGLAHANSGSWWRFTTKPLLTSQFNSAGMQDGWILETSEISGKGGTLDPASTTFRLGDDKTKKQYRGILSFATGATLPDKAVITKVTLKVRKQGITGGGNPVTMFQGFMVDIKKGTFGTSALQAADFQTAASKSYGPFTTALSGGWYSIDLTSGKIYINKLSSLSGLTQIRLRFKLDDNSNAVANYLSLYSGNAPAASRPQLIIQYYVP